MKLNLLPNVIIVSGRAKSGKDTFSNLLTDSLKEHELHHNYYPIRLSFAEEVKRKAANDYNLDFEKFINDFDYKEKYRDILIKVSNEARVNNPFIWCDMVHQKYNKLLPNLPKNKIPLLIISDNRYYNEIDYYSLINKELFNKVITVHIHCNNIVMKDRIGEANYYKWSMLAKDRSERELNPTSYEYDYIVSNNKSQEVLKNISFNIFQEEFNILK